MDGGKAGQNHINCNAESVTPVRLSELSTQPTTQTEGVKASASIEEWGVVFRRPKYAAAPIQP